MVRNTGSDKVVDLLRPWVRPNHRLDVATPEFSLFVFEILREELAKLHGVRLILLIHLLRVNVLKRMESAVSSFALTVERQLRDVEATLARIEAQVEELEEIDIDAVDIEDSAFSRACSLGARSRCCSRMWTSYAGNRTSWRTETGWRRS